MDSGINLVKIIKVSTILIILISLILAIIILVKVNKNCGNNTTASVKNKNEIQATPTGFKNCWDCMAGAGVKCGGQPDPSGCLAAEMSLCIANAPPGEQPSCTISPAIKNIICNSGTSSPNSDNCWDCISQYTSYCQNNNDQSSCMEQIMQHCLSNGNSSQSASCTILPVIKNKICNNS